MNFVKGDLWSEVGRADCILFTGNSVINSNGELVMGAAKGAKQRFPFLPSRLGALTKGREEYGIVTCAASVEVAGADFGFRIGSFQTKRNWKDPSDIELIARSMTKLLLHAHRFERIALNFPGIGMGGLPRAEVLKAIDVPCDNIWVYEF